MKGKKTVITKPLSKTPGVAAARELPSENAEHAMKGAVKDRVLPFKVPTAIALALALAVAVMAGPRANAAGSPPALGAAANFAILAGAAVTCTGGTVTGNVGVFPGTAITQTGCVVTGSVNAGDLVAAPAQNDFVIAYNDIATQTCDQALTGLGSLTLAPGVYCFDAAATETGGVLTLDGPADGIWIFKIGTLGTGALTGTGFSVVTTGGGQASNVYWHVAQAATFTDSHFLGTILAGAGITMTRGTFDGRALANAAVTITGTAVSGFAN